MLHGLQDSVAKLIPAKPGVRLAGFAHREKTARRDIFVPFFEPKSFVFNIPISESGTFLARFAVCNLAKPVRSLSFQSGDNSALAALVAASMG